MLLFTKTSVVYWAFLSNKNFMLSLLKGSLLFTKAIKYRDNIANNWLFSLTIIPFLSSIFFQLILWVKQHSYAVCYAALAASSTIKLFKRQTLNRLCSTNTSSFNIFHIISCMYKLNGTERNKMRQKILTLPPPPNMKIQDSYPTQIQVRIICICLRMI